MGGFEGGDEGGYWDVDTLHVSNNQTKKRQETFIEFKNSIYSIRAHAKLKSDDACFIRNDELYDTISFVPCVTCSGIEIEGYENILPDNNPILQAYEALNEYVSDPDVLEFFCNHKVVVHKSVPSYDGFKMEASHAAAFLRLAKEACNLVLSLEELIDLGRGIDEDFDFFVYNYAFAKRGEEGEIFELHTRK